MLIANNEECDYIVRNIEAVLALEESLDRARLRVPKWVNLQLFKEIHIRMGELPKGIKTKWSIEEDSDSITITPMSFYDDHIDFGLWYGIEFFNWQSLIPQDKEEGLWIYLFYELPEKMPKGSKSQFEEWENSLLNAADKSRPELLRKYHVRPNEGYLVVYYMNNLLNLHNIKDDFNGTVAKTIDALIQFIDDTKDLLTPL